MPKPHRDNIDLVSQKEYMFVTPHGKKSFVGTLSVRGCYAIAIYHPEKSAFVHWDDNVDYSQIEKIVHLFLGDNLVLRDCKVMIAGGWPDHEGSNIPGLFLKDFFEEKGCQLHLDFFQKKQAESVDEYTVSKQLLDRQSLSKFGFSSVLLDVNTGELIVSDDWQQATMNSVRGDLGSFFQQRNAAKLFADRTHYQSKEHLNSGTSLMSRDEFESIQKIELNALCIAARDNDVEALIRLLDKGIIDIDTPGPNDWRALHFACKLGHYKCAEILIDHGANISLENDKQKTALQLVEDNPQARKRLSVAAGIIAANRGSDLTQGCAGIAVFSIFARHPEQLDLVQRAKISSLKDKLSIPERCDELGKQLRLTSM